MLVCRILKSKTAFISYCLVRSKQSLDISKIIMFLKKIKIYKKYILVEAAATATPLPIPANKGVCPPNFMPSEMKRDSTSKHGKVVFPYTSEW